MPRDEVLNDDDDDDLLERGAKRSTNENNDKQSRRRIQGPESEDDALLNLNHEEPVFRQSKGWSVDWMVRNPMSGRTWNIHDENVQRKILDMIQKSKPEYIEITTNGNDEKSKKLNDFCPVYVLLKMRMEGHSLSINT